MNNISYIIRSIDQNYIKYKYRYSYLVPIVTLTIYFDNYVGIIQS